MEQSVPKRRYIKFRRRGIAQKKACNNLFFVKNSAVTSIVCKFWASCGQK